LASIENGLQASGIQSTWLMGQMSIQQRDNSLLTFREDRECNVLLGSIAAAGVGIDLRCAQIVYIMVSTGTLLIWCLGCHEPMYTFAGTKLESGDGGSGY